MLCPDSAGEIWVGLGQNGSAGETPPGHRLSKQTEQKCKYLPDPHAHLPVRPGRQNKVPETHGKEYKAACSCLLYSTGSMAPRPAVAGQLHWPASPLWSEDPVIPLLGTPWRARESFATALGARGFGSV